MHPSAPTRNDNDRMAADLTLRTADLGDMPSVTAIYAHYVRTSLATFELEPPDAAEMGRRYRQVQGTRCPYLVAESGGDVLGFAYAAPYRPRPAYALTVEDSVYLAPAATAKGIGTDLLKRLIHECRRRGFRQMVAVIGGGLEHAASVRLHARCDFRQIGVLRGVGRKFDRWVDTLLMQRSLVEP